MARKKRGSYKKRYNASVGPSRDIIDRTDPRAFFYRNDEDIQRLLALCEAVLEYGRRHGISRHLPIVLPKEIDNE